MHSLSSLPMTWPFSRLLQLENPISASPLHSVHGYFIFLVFIRHLLFAPLDGGIHAERVADFVPRGFRNGAVRLVVDPAVELEPYPFQDIDALRFTPRTAVPDFRHLLGRSRRQPAVAFGAIFAPREEPAFRAIRQRFVGDLSFGAAERTRKKLNNRLVDNRLGGVISAFFHRGILVGFGGVALSGGATASALAEEKEINFMPRLSESFGNVTPSRYSKQFFLNGR